jgi:hypothetical protein
MINARASWTGCVLPFVSGHDGCKSKGLAFLLIIAATNQRLIITNRKRRTGNKKLIGEFIGQDKTRVVQKGKKSITRKLGNYRRVRQIRKRSGDWEVVLFWRNIIIFWAKEWKQDWNDSSDLNHEINYWWVFCAPWTFPCASLCT